MELKTSGEPFRAILKGSRFGKKLGKLNIQHETVDFSFDGQSLCVTVIGVDAQIPAAGAWSGIVQLPLVNWSVLQKVPPAMNELVLRFDVASSKLFIGSTGFKATWLPG